MSLVELAQETLNIVKRGEYQAANGTRVQIREEVAAAINGTRLYTPEQLAELLKARQDTKTGAGTLPVIEVTPETTGAASRRLYTEGVRDFAALNFASARNPGGGFIRGTKAQEEDLARCSALYDCQLPHRTYYDANRNQESLLYTDHIIYSPDVPFFRDERLDLLDVPFFTSIITAPAPNAGEFLQREPRGLPQVRAALERRAGMVLCVAAEEKQRVLVLGAWGCGVFRNVPADVADVFAMWLRHPGFAGAFDRVVFGIYERDKDRPTLEVFKRKLVRP
jgi:uncharacterized protein (TIGR02452 family)